MKYNRKKIRRTGIGILAAALAVTGIAFYCRTKEISPSEIIEEAQNQEDDGNMRMHFLDVGQGSAVLVKANGKFMMIDGGGESAASKVTGYLKEMEAEELDYILITDYDEDHLAGVVEILKNFPVSHILSPDCTSDTEVFARYQEVIREKEIEVLHPNLGEIYSFGNTFFTIVGPAYYGHEDGRNDSLCIRLDYGDTRFLFCGDTKEAGEAELAREALDNPEVDLQADVYAVNAHGAAGSGTEEFLNCVRPEYAVLSCGVANEEGCPSEEVMEQLKEREIRLFRTDMQGTIEAVSDGSTVTWNMKPCNDYSWRE
ncbi:MAG: MBL fold metallo-hydrolase [Candidatus Limivivens sp.]|nr:MBL fold metallo-hydrolase [Candidatus Limivivens sp.]